MRHALSHRAALIGSAGIVLAGVGCSILPAPSGPKDGGAPVSGPLGPFAPHRMRIYPLTHLTISREGEPEIVLHVELTDRWDDTVKGVGVLYVSLSRPGGLGELGSGTGVAEVTWELDLRDPGVSTGYYDPATRTYRITLTGLPAWVAEMARREPGREDGAQRLFLRATFETTDASGQRILLTGDHVIRR